MYNIGIDVGGMSIKAGVVHNGEIIHRAVIETDPNGGVDKLVEDITSLVNTLITENNIGMGGINTIGIGLPGVVTRNGSVTCVNSVSYTHLTLPTTILV